jgi:hypothetical protein
MKTILFCALVLAGVGWYRYANAAPYPQPALLQAR